MTSRFLSLAFYFSSYMSGADLTLDFYWLKITLYFILSPKPVSFKNPKLEVEFTLGL